MKFVGLIILTMVLFASSFFAYPEIVRKVIIPSYKINQAAKEAVIKDIIALADSQKSVKKDNSYFVDGMAQFVANYEDLFRFMENEKILFRFQVQRYFAKYLRPNDLKSEDVPSFNNDVNQTVRLVLDQSNILKLSPSQKEAFAEKILKLRNPVFLSAKINKDYSSVEKSVATRNDILKKIDSLIVEKNASYESISKNRFFTFFSGVCFLSFLLGFLFQRRTETKSPTIEDQREKSPELNSELRRVMNEMECPLVICDSSFEIIWGNSLALKMGMNKDLLKNKMARVDFDPQKAMEINFKRFHLKVSELNYQSGKKHFFIQFSPAIVAQQMIEHFANSNDVERALQSSLSTAHEFLSLNDVVLNTAASMNYFFKSSNKILDIDLKKDMSETFVGHQHLTEMAKSFLHVAYTIIKDQPLVDGIYLRTDEVDNRLEVSAFLPNMTQNEFDQHFDLQEVVKKLSQIETRFNLYDPRLSFRWVDTGKVVGMDMRLMFANRNAVETILNRADSTV